MKCNHCGKAMDINWGNITKGYCWNCRMSGFSYAKEWACKMIFKLLKQIME